MDESSNLLIYKNDNGDIVVDAIYKDETLWLTQKGMSKVFDVQVPAISKHLKNIFDEEELIKESVVSKMEITADDGKNYKTEVYNLDADTSSYSNVQINLKRAIKSHFSNPKHFGEPKYKSKHNKNQSYTTSVTILRECDGKYYASLLYEYELLEENQTNNEFSIITGIDLGNIFVKCNFKVQTSDFKVQKLHFELD